MGLQIPQRTLFPQCHFVLAIFAVLSSLSCGRVSHHPAINDGGGSPGAGSTDVDGNNNHALADGTNGNGAARTWDGGDGAKLFMNWEDTQLGIACLFLKGADGTWHCQPDLERIQYCPADVHDEFSRYVAATEIIDMSTEPLSARILIAKDGSRENAGLFDVRSLLRIDFGQRLRTRCPVQRSANPYRLSANKVWRVYPDTRLDPENAGVVASRAITLPFGALAAVSTYVE